MRALGADLVEHGADFQAAREEAMRVADARGFDPVPAFHRDLALGVATYALELFDERVRTSTCSTFRSARAREFAAASPRATRWG